MPFHYRHLKAVAQGWAYTGTHCIFASPSGLDSRVQPLHVATPYPGPSGLTCHSFCGDIEVSAVQGLGGPGAIALGHEGCRLLQGALL